MVSISVQDLTYRFENGRTLFCDLTFTLDNQITGLVGRNGAGKSRLAALLAGECLPYSGSVNSSSKVGLLQQVTTLDSVLEYERVSEFLGIHEILEALDRITAGGCDPNDYDLIGDRWLLKAGLEQQLDKLGLPTNPYMLCNALSGGQLTRLALYRLFQSDYEYLILDEPSNHLDTKGRCWLIKQIQAFKGGVLIISHDRNLLRCVDSILELNTLGIRYYGGNYDVYIQQRNAELASQERRIEKTKAQLIKMRQTSQKNREKAQQRACQGKQKARSGSQAKILLNNNKQNAESSLGARENNDSKRIAQTEAELKAFSQQQEMVKPQSFALGKVKKRIARILDVTEVFLPFSYQRQAISFAINFGEKVRLLGANGSGKSTLLRVITGDVLPKRGEVRVRSRLCYLDQQFQLLDNNQSALENLATLCAHLNETNRRTLLASVGLNRERADQQIATLSGGEKMKVAMLAVSYQAGDTLLLLDEPDNHLDIDSRAVLAQALRSYTGSVLVVSHDQDFIDDIGITKEVILSEE